MAYREKVIPIEEVGTDPAREQAVTPAFVEASNAVAIARGRHARRGDGRLHVPPPLVDVWARGPYGHAGQWPTLHVMAMAPKTRPRHFVVAPDGAYDLEAVGVRTRSIDASPPTGSEYVYDADAGGLGVDGHPFLADLGGDAAAVIEYLEGVVTIGIRAPRRRRGRG